MQILKKTNLESLKKAQKLGADGVIDLVNKKGLVGRGGAGFLAGKKWKFALDTKSDEKFVICNADEGEPGTFKDKFILENNPETLIEGILIASFVVGAKRSFIYLRGEYDYLKNNLEKVIKRVVKDSKLDISVEVCVGAGAYICGEETAIIKSIEGFRGQPYYKPPFPPVSGLWGKPTVINNVETLTCAAQAVLFDDWNPSLRLLSVSGSVDNPGVFEVPLGVRLSQLLSLAKPRGKLKALYFGCFGGCMPYKDMDFTPENICGEDCIHGSCSVIVVDDSHSVVDLSYVISKFFANESCGKCTPCREGTIRVMYIMKKLKDMKATKEDLSLLEELAHHIKDTSLCGLGQSATNHILTGLKHFREDFEERIL